MDFLKQHIEALIFASPTAIPLAEIQSVLNETFQQEISENEILGTLENTRSPMTPTWNTGKPQRPISPPHDQWMPSTASPAGGPNPPMANAARALHCLPPRSPRH